MACCDHEIVYYYFQWNKNNNIEDAGFTTLLVKIQCRETANQTSRHATGTYVLQTDVLTVKCICSNTYMHSETCCPCLWLSTLLY